MLRQEQGVIAPSSKGLRSLLAARCSAERAGAMSRRHHRGGSPLQQRPNCHPSAIRTAVHTAGRADKLNEMTAILTRLRRRGRVRRADDKRVYYLP